MIGSVRWRESEWQISKQEEKLAPPDAAASRSNPPSPPSSSVSLFTRHVLLAHRYVYSLPSWKSLLFTSPAISLHPLITELLKRIAPDFISFPTMVSWTHYCRAFDLPTPFKLFFAKLCLGTEGRWQQGIQGRSKSWRIMLRILYFVLRSGERGGILQQVSDMIRFPRNKLSGFSADYELEHGETT